MECDQYRYKRIDCDELQKLIYFPCTDVQTTGGGRGAYSVEGTQNEKSLYKLSCKAHKLIPPGQDPLKYPYATSLIVQLSFRNQTENHYGTITMWRPTGEKQYCYYLGKYPFNWSYPYNWGPGAPYRYTKLLTISNEWPPQRNKMGDLIDDINVSVRLTREGRPDIKLCQYITQMTPEEIKENYNEQQQWIISEWKQRWKRYDLEHQVCTEKYENLGRPVEVINIGMPGTLTDIRIVRQLRKIYVVTLQTPPTEQQWLTKKQFKYLD